MDAALCFGFRKCDWKALAERLNNEDEGAWVEAIGVFERRIRERFIRSIDALAIADTRHDENSAQSENIEICIPGFSIIALCCLLIETLQGFREKNPAAVAVSGPCGFPSGACIRPPSGTRQQYQSFLNRPAFGCEFKGEIARDFVNGIRNGMFHEAETRKWVIWRNEPKGKIVGIEEDGHALNRTLFYAAVKKEFESYLDDLRQPANKELRTWFKKKMNDLHKEA